MDVNHRAQRRRPTFAKEWQLAVLKKLQSESGNPTEQQRTAAAKETGLDEKWVRNWFTRQRSKLGGRNRKSRPTTDTEPYHAATVPTFKLKLSPLSLQQTVSAPTSLNKRVATYSRDPLYNRYPDFSQFFRPDVHERFRTLDDAPPFPVAFSTNFAYPLALAWYPLEYPV